MPRELSLSDSAMMYSPRATSSPDGDTLSGTHRSTLPFRDNFRVADNSSGIVECRRHSSVRPAVGSDQAYTPAADNRADAIVYDWRLLINCSEFETQPKDASVRTSEASSLLPGTL